jgi:hypothetical protein
MAVRKQREPESKDQGHDTRFKDTLLVTDLLSAGLTKYSFHHLPTVHSTMNLSGAEAIGEVRALIIQSAPNPHL